MMTLDQNQSPRLAHNPDVDHARKCTCSPSYPLGVFAGIRSPAPSWVAVQGILPVR